MPLPEWRKRLPSARSIAQRVRANLLQHDLIRPFGPSGASATVTHDSLSLLGNPPRSDEWNTNPLVTSESTAPAARPAKTRSKSDLVR